MRTRVEVWMQMVSTRTMKVTVRRPRGTRRINSSKKAKKMGKGIKARAMKSRARKDIQAPNFQILNPRETLKKINSQITEAPTNRSIFQTQINKTDSKQIIFLGKRHL